MKLELYHFQSCPYCIKVRNFIDKKGFQDRITYFDILDDNSANQRLLKLTGDDQVPCLVVDGKPILESDDIIRWLDENLAL